MRRALISVTDKTELGTLGIGLHRQGFELVSTGGTGTALREHELPVIDVSVVTNFPEMLEGRLKTLHPHIFGGILGRPDRPSDLASLAEHGIELFDVVVVNLYAFEKKAQDPKLSFDDLVENIDIGGPSLIRAAAKNWRHVWVVTSPSDYPRLLHYLESEDESKQLAARYQFLIEAIEYTSRYDRGIAAELNTNSAFRNGEPVRLAD